MKSFFTFPGKRAGVTLCILFFVLLLTGCPGTVNPDNQETAVEDTNTSSNLNFKEICAVNDYAVLTWDESTNKKLSYYVLEFENTGTKKKVKSDKIQKTGGPYKYKLKGFEIGNSKYANYRGSLQGYDSSNNKLFSQYTSFSVYKSELSNYKVSYDSSTQKITHSWTSNDIYGRIKKIEILSSESKDGTYTVCKTLDSVYSTSYNLTDIEIGKTYWFRLRSYDTDGNIITELTSDKCIKLEKTVPAKIQNLKTTTSEYYNVVNLSWEKNPFATSYTVQAYSESALKNLLFEKTVTENNASFTIDCIESSKSMYFVVKGINEIGEGPVSSSVLSYISPVYLYAKVAATVSDVTADSAKVLLKMVHGSNNTEYVLKDVTLEYALYKDSAVYKAYQKSNEFNLTGLDFASKTSFRPAIKINYSLDGLSKTYELISSSNIDVETKGFPAPSGTWTADKITRTSITLTYPKLTEEQRCGLAEEDIVYVISAYHGDSAYPVTRKTAAYGENTVTVTSLSSASDYCFTVYAKKKVNGSATGEASERSQIFTTKASLSKPVIKSITEAAVDGVQAPYSNIKVSFDPIAEDAEEEIKYGLIWDIMNESSLSLFDYKSEEAKENITQITQKVNGGNRYIVSLYAYAAADGEKSSVYSDRKTIQLAAVDDKHILPGLYYKDEAGASNAGELVDIVNPATWSSGSSPKSTNTAFKWGTSNKTGSYAIKFKLTDEMLNCGKFDLKIIFAAQRYPYKKWAIDGTTLAYGVIVRLINPVTGDKLTEFVNYTTSSSVDSFHVPDLSSSDSKPASQYVGSYIMNFEKYMFNNSVYFGLYVPPKYKEYSWSSEIDNSQNCIAFSYFIDEKK